MTRIISLDQLEALYRRRLSEASPFAVLTTIGPEGIDCAPSMW